MRRNSPVRDNIVFRSISNKAKNREFSHAKDENSLPFLQLHPLREAIRGWALRHVYYDDTAAGWDKFAGRGLCPGSADTPNGRPCQSALSKVKTL